MKKKLSILVRLVIIVGLLSPSSARIFAEDHNQENLPNPPSLLCWFSDDGTFRCISIEEMSDNEDPFVQYNLDILQRLLDALGFGDRDLSDTILFACPSEQAGLYGKSEDEPLMDSDVANMANKCSDWAAQTYASGFLTDSSRASEVENFSDILNMDNEIDNIVSQIDDAMEQCEDNTDISPKFFFLIFVPTITAGEAMAIGIGAIGVGLAIYSEFRGPQVIVVERTYIVEQPELAPLVPPEEEEEEEEEGSAEEPPLENLVTDEPEAPEEPPLEDLPTEESTNETTDWLDNSTCAERQAWWLQQKAACEPIGWANFLCQEFLGLFAEDESPLCPDPSLLYPDPFGNYGCHDPATDEEISIAREEFCREKEGVIDPDAFAVVAFVIPNGTAPIVCSLGEREVRDLVDLVDLCNNPYAMPHPDQVCNPIVDETSPLPAPDPIPIDSIEEGYIVGPIP